MKADTLAETEGVPAEYPAAPLGLTEDAAALDPATVWGRIEAYTAPRFTARSVTWLAEGPGHWDYRLKPAILTSAERWNGEAWEAVTLKPGPYGFILDEVGPYRIIAEVGGGDVPAVFMQAYTRLAEYLGDGQPDNILTGRPGAVSHSGKVGEVEETMTRNPAWLAMAMQWSGAADLLRNYRRA